MSTSHATRVEVFEGKKRRDGKQPKWYFRAIAGNHRKIDQSQGYATCWSAKRGARRAHPGVALSVIET